MNRNLVDEQEILNEVSRNAPYSQLFIALWWTLCNEKKNRLLYHYIMIKEYSWNESYRLAKEKKY